MRYTESWTWAKNPVFYTNKHIIRDGILHRLKQGYLFYWMRDYRNKIHAIKTDEQAQEAIYAFWQTVSKEWDEHLKGLSPKGQKNAEGKE